jgi:hypothetical protein
VWRVEFSNPDLTATLHSLTWGVVQDKDGKLDTELCSTVKSHGSLSVITTFIDGNLRQRKVDDGLTITDHPGTTARYVPQVWLYQ